MDALNTPTRFRWPELTPKRKLILLLVLSLTIVTLVFLHVRATNGPWYFKWSWQRLDSLRAFGVMLLGALPFFAGQMVYQRWRSLRAALLLAALSTFLLSLGGTTMYRQPVGLWHIAHRVESPFITSYFTVAARFAEGAQAKSLREVLANYPDLMPTFPFHALTKLPGPVLFYFALIKLLGAGAAPLAGGLLVGALAALGVPMVYWLLKQLLADQEAAFCRASFFGLTPCLAVFFPAFDQIYPQTIFWDLYDFALGTGWISYLLVGFAILRFCMHANRQTEMGVATQPAGRGANCRSRAVRVASSRSHPRLDAVDSNPGNSHWAGTSSLEVPASDGGLWLFVAGAECHLPKHDLYRISRTIIWLHWAAAVCEGNFSTRRAIPKHPARKARRR